MSECLHRLETERAIQKDALAEVRRLRAELRAAEERMNKHRGLLNSIGPQVTTAHEKINSGRRECFKLIRICQGLGINLMGNDYKYENLSPPVVNIRKTYETRPWNVFELLKAIQASGVY